MSDDAVGWERIKAHIALYRTDPEKAHDWNPHGKWTTALLLTATGRKSGKQRSLPLVYRKIDGNYVIVASKGGAPQHPVWYLNLLANPEAEIQVAREHYKVRARTAIGSERERLWAEMVDELPQYAEYKELTAREIPVVVLEPQ